jgi:methylase of polypeptide subunit release factors
VDPRSFDNGLGSEPLKRVRYWRELRVYQNPQVLPHVNMAMGTIANEGLGIKKPSVAVLDLGTGDGLIIAATIKELREIEKEVSICTCDISKTALKLLPGSIALTGSGYSIDRLRTSIPHLGTRTNQFVTFVLLSCS